MGEYRMEKTKTAQRRPVYKKTDRDYYIFYSSILLLSRDNSGITVIVLGQ